MAYTLAPAAEAAKVSKPTVFRWIKAGKLSATKTDSGNFRIDPAELHRYLDSIAKEELPTATAQQTVSPGGSAVTPPETLHENISLRSEVDKLKALLDAEKKRADELRDDRDRWADQAQRLALPSPETNGNAGWWRFRRRA